MNVKLTAAAAALALVGVATAATNGDTLTLAPAGDGEGTYAGWKAQEGRADSLGSANQALYLQNLTVAGDTSAAAIVKGFEGTPVRELTSIGYEYRVKGSKCTKTDPRWTLFIRGKSGHRYIASLGCAVTPARPTGDPAWVGRVFTQPLIRAEVLKREGRRCLCGHGRRARVRA